MDFNQPPLSVNADPMEGADPHEAESEVRAWTVPAAAHGERLDKALVHLLPEFSRSHVQQLIAQGCVSDPSKTLSKASIKVKAGQPLRVELRPTEESQAFLPQDLPIETVYADDQLRVIHKPAGLVVHPAPGHWSGTLLNGLLSLDPLSPLLPRAGIVHRLDKDTSGLMMVARTRLAMDTLIRAIAERQVKREYLALVQGQWPHGDEVSLAGPIGRDPKNRLRMAVLDPARHPTKAALTHVRLLQQGPAHALLHCRLDTGRTHQIRVHLSHAGYPLGLHAWRLSLLHPHTGQALAWMSPPPLDLQDTLQILGVGYNFSQ
jgi:23S rRNA pseudouridine1911/1915/1917 synthase